MSGIDFHSQISAIMQALAGAAVAEICKLIEESGAALRLEIKHSRQENEFLRNRVRVMERALLNTERERDPPGFSQLKRSAVSSRTEHNSTDQHTELPGQANSIKNEPVDLEKEPDVLIVKEETVQPAFGGSSCAVQLSFRANLCHTKRIYTSQEPNSGTGSKEGKMVLSVESAVQQVAFVAVDTTETGVQSEASVGTDLKMPIAEAETTGSDFDQQHLENLSAQQSTSTTEVKSDFLAVEEEPDGLAAVLQGGSDQSFLQENGASEQQNLGFVDSFTGVSLDHVSWICDRQVHSNQTPSGPSDCAVCGKSFSHTWQLKHHERVHAEERVYRCGRCGRQFPQLCRLKRHERVHTGEKPFRCSKCGKHFSQANNLKVHQSVHTGERRFSCAQCGKNFSFLSNLIRHKALHSGK
ncbi:zinc finger and SCAN domain-containing protein 2 isoform X2 [Astyanax mexicanus]|uniref:zinc finger and SCAN domain-containing protein 2 isoform X2 n=1 Tax=Astyanax mexicanus TaxID=7994 RepID=UPI000BBDDB5C|nr:zinc finger and SCAN domain-containing protein 2 isoform X2 [Astyanax mexicanus]